MPTFFFHSTPLSPHSSFASNAVASTPYCRVGLTIPPAVCLLHLRYPAGLSDLRNSTPHMSTNTQHSHNLQRMPVCEIHDNNQTTGSSLDIAFLQWPFVPTPKRSICPQLRQHPSCAARNKPSMVGAAVSKTTLVMSPFSTKTTTKLRGNLQHAD